MALKKNKDLVPIDKLTVFARIVELVMLIEIALLFAIFFQTYAQLPSLVPVHFGLNGQPDVYNLKSSFLALPFVLSLIPLITIATAELRRKLVNKYPWVISLPAFYLMLSKLPKKGQSYWVNKYFEAVLMMGAVVGLAMEMMQLVLLNFFSGTNDSGLLAYPLVLIMFAVIEFFFALRFFSKRMKG